MEITDKEALKSYILFFRIFSSRFLSDQSSLGDGAGEDQLAIGSAHHLDTRVLAYDLSNINIQMKVSTRPSLLY